MPLPEFDETNFRTLLRRLTLKASRMLSLYTTARFEPVIGEHGSSPEDFAIAVLGKWLVGDILFNGPPEERYAFLSVVLVHDILDVLKKRNVKASRSGKTIPVETLVEDPLHGSTIEKLSDIRQLVRDEAFRRMVESHVRDDKALQELVYAIFEWDGDGVPAPREIAALLGVSVPETQNRRRKLARRLTKAGLKITQAGQRA